MKKFLAVVLALAVLSALALTAYAHGGHKAAWSTSSGACRSCGGCLYDGICRNESCPGSQNGVCPRCLGGLSGGVCLNENCPGCQNGGVCVNDGVCQNNGGVCRSGSYAHGGHHAW